MVQSVLIDNALESVELAARELRAGTLAVARELVAGALQEIEQAIREERRVRHQPLKPTADVRLPELLEKNGQQINDLPCVLRERLFTLQSHGPDGEFCVH